MLFRSVLVKKLAREQHSAALAQLASRVSAVAKYGATDGEDPFAKIKGMIQDMIEKLEKNADADAEEKAYCDEQMAKTKAKKEELEAAVAKAQEAIKAAKLKLAQKIAGANSFVLEAKKVALTEYRALQEKVEDAQTKLAPYLRVRKDQEQRIQAKKILDEVSATLGSVEVEVEKVTSTFSGNQPSEDEIKAADALAPPVLANLNKSLRLVEMKMRVAQGALKQDLQQRQDRGMESKKKLEAFRMQCRTSLEKSQLKELLKQEIGRASCRERV